MTTSGNDHPHCDRRVLVIDDDLTVQKVFQRVLGGGTKPARESLGALRASLFGGEAPKPPDSQSDRANFQVTVASQGEAGFAEVQRSILIGKPFLLAFVDMRMPPGWDGLQTSMKITGIAPELPIVICSACSDYSWKDVIDRLPRTRVQFLPKPFETKDILDIAYKFAASSKSRK